MKWINAEQQVTVTIYDEEHEEHLDKVMTVEEMLDTYTNDGCPTMYSNPERKTGKWIKCVDGVCYWYECSECGEKPLWNEYRTNRDFSNYCPSCGCRMERDLDGNAKCARKYWRFKKC